MCHITTRIHSEKCFVRQFCHCVNTVACTAEVEVVWPVWYSLLLLGCKCIQHVTVQNTKTKSSTRENDTLETLGKYSQLFYKWKEDSLNNAKYSKYIHQFVTVKYYVLYITVCAVLLYSWQLRGFGYIGITAREYNTLCCDVMIAGVSLGDRKFSAPL